MPTESTGHDTTSTSLIDLIRKEGEQAGIVYNYSDLVFIRKIEALANKVSREWEIVYAFRAFAADPLRGCTPFFFPDRFEKYRAKVAKAGPATPGPERESLFVECPVCHSLYQRHRAAGCNYCEEHPRGIPSMPIVLQWRRGAREPGPEATGAHQEADG